MTQNRTVNHVLMLIEGVETDGFYGSIELKFESGRLVLIRQSQNFKPFDLERNTREVTNEQRSC